jgi:xylan 1,4-beta-xylosidase
MEWQDGWLRLAGGGNKARLTAPLPSGVKPKPASNSEFRDDFDSNQLNVQYDFPRVPASGFASLLARLGWLRLTGQESLNSLHNVSLVALRQQELNVTAQTEMEFAPKYPEQMAGLAYVYDALHFYLLCKTADETGRAVLGLIKSDGGNITDLITPVPIPEGKIGLRATSSECGTVEFCWQSNGSRWQTVGEVQPLSLLTDEHCRGFTGAQFGMYVHDMTGLGAYADFDSFEII